MYGWYGWCDVDLQEGVTDSGLHALVSAGCGAQLSSLTLAGECCCVFVVMYVVVAVHIVSEKSDSGVM